MLILPWRLTGLIDRERLLVTYAGILKYLSARNWEHQEVYLCAASQYSLANILCLIISSSELT